MPAARGPPPCPLQLNLKTLPAEVLHLGGALKPKQGMTEAAQSLQTLHHLRVLSLGTSGQGAVLTASVLRELCTSWIHLESLNLSGTGVGDEACAALSDRCGQLHTLLLSESDIGEGVGLALFPRRRPEWVRPDS